MEGLALEYTKKCVGIPDLTDKKAYRIWEKCANGTPMAMFLFRNAARRRPLSELLKLPIWDVAGAKTKWLDLIFKNLTSSESKCWQAISVFSTHIPYEALEYVYNNDDLQIAIGGLQDKGLLDHKPGSDNWHIRHDIIREYVSEKELTPTVRDELERRLVEYYTRFVLESDQYPKQLQSEAANILGAMDWYRRKQREESMQIIPLIQQLPGIQERAALQITYNIGELASRSGDEKWAAELYGEVVELAERKNYPAEQAKALRQLGHQAKREGNHTVAITKLKGAVEVGRTAGEAAWDTIATSCHLLGRLLYNSNRYALAEQYLLEGLQAAKESKKQLTVAKIVGSLAYLYGEKNEFEKADELYRKEQYNLSGEPLAILLFGMLPRWIEIGEFDKARKCIQEARDIFEEANNLGGIAYTWRLQGDWHCEQGELELAEESFREEERLRRLAVEEDEKEILHLFHAMWKQFHFFQETNQLDKARQCLARYKAIQNKPDWLIPQILGHEAVLLIALGDHQGASQRCHEAMDIFQEQDSIGGRAWIKRIQGDIRAAQGQFEAATKLYEEGLELRICQNEPWFTATDLERLAEFYLRQMRDVEQARKYLEQAQQEYRLVNKRKASAIGERLRVLTQKISCRSRQKNSVDPK